MDFDFSPEQIQLRKQVREFAEGEIAPHVRQWDEHSTFPMDVVRKMGELGYLGVIFPEEYGGAGLGYVDYVIVLEELSRVDGSVGLILAAHHSLCSNHIYRFGSEEQKRRYLPDLTTCKRIGCWGLTEPEAGSDAAATRSTAALSPDGETWTLNGAKTFCTNGGVADVCVAMAVTDRSQSSHGISAFVLEKGMAGFRPGRKEDKLGCRASDTSEVIFSDCRVPKSHLLGNLGHGFVDSLKVLDGGRISIAAWSIGMAQGAYEAALRYSKQRRQFGKAISEFQAIQWKLADMSTEIAAGRWLTYRTAWMADNGRHHTLESAQAKLYTSEVAVRAANESVQIHGGYGYVKDYPAEKFYRDVKLCTIGEGTSEIQRLVIARALLRA